MANVRPIEFAFVTCCHTIHLDTCARHSSEFRMRNQCAKMHAYGLAEDLFAIDKNAMNIFLSLEWSLLVTDFGSGGLREKQKIVIA